MNIITIYGPLLLGGGIILLLLAKLINRGGSTSCISEDEIVILEVKVPRIDDSDDSSNQLSPLAAESMFAAIHGLLQEDPGAQEHFSFEVVSQGDEGIHFYVAVPRRVSKFVESQIYAQYHRAMINESPDYIDMLDDLDFLEVANLELSKPYFLPLKSFLDLEVDPLSGITSVLSHATGGDFLGIQVVAKPAPDVWQSEGYRYTESVRGGSSYRRGGSPGELRAIISTMSHEIGLLIVDVATGLFRGPSEGGRWSYTGSSSNGEAVRLSPSQELEIKSVENKLSKLGYFVQIRIISGSSDRTKVDANLRSAVATMKQFYTATTNGFRKSSSSKGNAYELERFKSRCIDHDEAFILNVEELASVYHLPSSSIATPNMSAWVYSKKAEPPSELPTKDCTYIGETIYRDKKMKFGLKDGDDRLRHMYLIGKSGTGKSSLLETMVSQDIAKGFGVGVLDPHGETIETILTRIPEERIDDVVVVDPSDLSRPVGVNLLELDDPDQKNLMASALVSAIKHHFDYSWGPRLEYLLNYSILTLLEAPRTTLLGVTRLLEDPNYLKYVLHYVEDPVIHKFWNTEYKSMKGNNRLVTEAIAPIQNKVNRFLASSTIRNILGQQESTIDIGDIMNSGKILLMNLSKGKVGEDNANLLGALLVSRIQFMALQRAKIPPQDRRPFYLYVDEFQNFATGSFESILSESRKYKLGLYLTHQYTSQLPEDLLDAVLGNVGTIASFALGAPDALAMSKEFAPFFDQHDLISMERFHIYIKLMIDGMTSMPFSARILLPWDDKHDIVPKYDNKEAVLERSRREYGVEVDKVREEINTWTETQFDKGKAISETGRSIGRGEQLEEVEISSTDKKEGELDLSGEVLLQDVSGFEEGEIHDGIVRDIAGFGAFVEVKPGIKGLVHISEIADVYVKKVEDVVDPDSSVRVRVLSVEDTGKISLSMKGLNPEIEMKAQQELSKAEPAS